MAELVLYRDLELTTFGELKPNDVFRYPSGVSQFRKLNQFEAKVDAIDRDIRFSECPVATVVLLGRWLPEAGDCPSCPPGHKSCPGAARDQQASRVEPKGAEFTITGDLFPDVRTTGTAGDDQQSLREPGSPGSRTPKNEFEIKAGDSLGIALHKMWYEEKQTVDTSIEAHVTREAVEQTIVDFLAVEDPEVQIIYGSTGEKWTIKYDGEEFAAGITTKQVVTVSYKTVDDWVCQRIRNHYKMKQQAAFVDHIRQGGEFTGCKVKIIGEIKREAGQAGG